MAKRIVLACGGSHGDLNPYIGLAVALKARGHRPVVATMPLYRENVEREGVEFAALGPQVYPNDRELMARIMHPRRGTERVARKLTTLLEAPYRQRAADVAAVVTREGGADAAADAIEKLLD